VSQFLRQSKRRREPLPPSRPALFSPALRRPQASLKMCVNYGENDDRPLATGRRAFNYRCEIGMSGSIYGTTFLSVDLA
jgi:hypothetical protein